MIVSLFRRRISSLFFLLSALAETSFGQASIPISEAKKQPLGSVVSVRGRVTVANQLGGPSFLQDPSGGIAVFNTSFHSAVQIGDSVLVSGGTAEFQNGGIIGKGLFQISNNVTFEVIGTTKRLINPILKRIQDLSEADESMLVKVENVRINAFEKFAGNSTYTFGDSQFSSDLRIYTAADAAGKNAISIASSIVGVVGEFRGARQIAPRFYSEIVQGTLPSAGISANETLDIVTWNIEWLGYVGNGPSDEALQVQNAAQVMRSIGADVFAFQEISNLDRFNEMISLVPDYRGFVAPYAIDQKTAYAYNSLTVDSISARLIPFNESSATDNPFASRFPFLFTVKTKISGSVEETVHLVNIHAKAFSDQASYARRVDASTLLKTHLDDQFSGQKVVLLGDFNDDLDVSTYVASVSPYQNFVSDNAKWITPTLSFSKSRISSYSSGTDPIDHLVFSKSFEPNLLESDTHVFNVSGVTNFSNTTSDHYPVVARVKLNPVTANERMGFNPERLSVAAYPNPFNPSTTLQISARKTERARLSIFDLSGRLVFEHAELSLSAGQIFSKMIDLSAHASGIYVVQVHTESGEQGFLKLSLVK